MADLIRKSAIAILVISVVFLTFLSILSIWDVIADDVMGKALSTIGVIGFACLVIIIASNAWENHKEQSRITQVPPQNPPVYPPRQG